MGLFQFLALLPEFRRLDPTLPVVTLPLGVHFAQFARLVFDFLLNACKTQYLFLFNVYNKIHFKCDYFKIQTFVGNETRL